MCRMNSSFTDCLIWHWKTHCRGQGGNCSMWVLLDSCVVMEGKLFWARAQPQNNQNLPEQTNEGGETHRCTDRQSCQGICWSIYSLRSLQCLPLLPSIHPSLPFCLSFQKHYFHTAVTPIQNIIVHTIKRIVWGVESIHGASLYGIIQSTIIQY